jgi:hypothetical protein
MMRISRVIILIMVIGCIAAQRTETVKIAKADTIVTVKVDTIKTVVWDTLVITKVVNDTSIVLKTDTAKVLGVVRTSAPVRVVKHPVKK